MAAHMNQKIRTCPTPISTLFTAMRSLIRMPHTVGKHKMKSVTCVLTCMEETCIKSDVKYECYTHENIQYRGII